MKNFTTKKKKILVIDDDPDFLRVICHHLKQIGSYQIKTSVTCLNAMQDIFTFKPDLVISDYHLPDSNGGKLRTAINQIIGTKIPCIFVSAESSSELNLKKQLGSELITFIKKPVSKHLLSEVLDQYDVKESESILAKSMIKTKPYLSHLGRSLFNVGNVDKGRNYKFEIPCEIEGDEYFGNNSMLSNLSLNSARITTNQPLIFGENLTLKVDLKFFKITIPCYVTAETASQGYNSYELKIFNTKSMGYSKLLKVIKSLDMIGAYSHKRRRR